MIEKCIRRFCAGFTMIELLIVVSLLGILSGVLLTVLKPEHFRDKSRDSVRISNVGKVVGAVEAYTQLEDGYPANVAALGNYVIWPDGSPTLSDTYTYTLVSAVVGPPAVVKHFTVSVPTSDTDYTYEYDSTVGKIQKCKTSDGSCTPLD